MTKLAVYRSRQLGRAVVGLVEASGESIRALLDAGGHPYEELYDVIEDWDGIDPSKLQTSEIAEEVRGAQFLAPLTGRDVLAVGKNYAAHASEFARSGYDSTDKNEQPDFPVIFTKRASSIVPTGSTIYPHPHATKTLDYEGELGVIVGKTGFRISKEDALKHVWGVVIVNDVTARERQRDHKQFYLGKSFDTFCPMGPYVVPASELDLGDLTVETKVNGETRQKANTSTLIFDVPTLIETISMGITIQPGDLIATGTPAGVGFGMKPPTFLKPGDTIEISISGIGTLTNTVGEPSMPIAPVTVRKRVKAHTSADEKLIHISNRKLLHVEVVGSGPPILFIHGLGGAANYYQAVIELANLKASHTVITYDFDGHGLSPLAASSLSIDSLAEDVKALLDTLDISKSSIVAHSMGCLVANTLAAKYSSLIDKMVLIGPFKALGEPGINIMNSRAAAVRSAGMLSIADAVVRAGTSEMTKSGRPAITAFVRHFLTSTSPEAYATACLALANGKNPDYAKIEAPILIIAGSEDKTAPPDIVEALNRDLVNSKLVTLQHVGHWQAIEDAPAVARLIGGFL